MRILVQSCQDDIQFNLPSDLMLRKESVQFQCSSKCEFSVSRVDLILHLYKEIVSTCLSSIVLIKVSLFVQYWADVG